MEITDVPGLLRSMLTEPARPRLTWYGPGAERVELSGKVLDNWVAKTANLLVDELDVGPGHRVGLDLPTHWRTAVWMLAVWSAGACVVLGEPDDPATGRLDVLVTSRWPAGPAPSPRTRLVAVALPALATSAGSTLPTGVLDAAAETRGQADVFLPPVRPAAWDPALEVRSEPARPAVRHDAPVGAVRHDALVGAAATGARALGVRVGDRVLTSAPPTGALAAWVGPWALGGSLVLHAGSAAAAAEPASLAEQEGVTLTLD